MGGVGVSILRVGNTPLQRQYEAWTFYRDRVGDMLCRQSKRRTSTHLSGIKFIL